MKNSVETAHELDLHVKSVISRANRLGFKKDGNFWYFTENQIKQIKEYKFIKQFQTKFYFSDDGQFLVINSRMNQYKRLFE